MSDLDGQWSDQRGDTEPVAVLGTLDGRCGSSPGSARSVDSKIRRCPKNQQTR